MSNKFNILASDPACTSCIKGYSKKHNLKSGDSFSIACHGIPKEYISPSVAESVPPEELKSMISMLDPVTWAAEVLDWHCIDPDGSIWKRKTAEGSLDEVTPYIEENHAELVKQGKSAFNRPYQKLMLSCSSARKVFRLGRQCGKTETMAIAMLHAVFTHKDYKVILITPYQTQVEVIFNRLNKLIKSNTNLVNSLKRYVKAPNYRIELHNGSMISGYTAGTKSGGNADAVRGSKANELFFDESDLLSSADMASALAVITNYPDAKVWMSSTPTGKREKFYDACYSPLWKEFYYPSMVNPLWNANLEAFYKGELSSIQYEHEIHAKFGEQAQGVYQTKYVDEALHDYKYDNQKPDSNWQYCIGVDWNDVKIGTTIAVVGFNPENSAFRLVERHVVSRDGWTQHAACEQIIRLNAHWKPKWIYVDRGFGGTQLEILRKFGYDSLADPNKGRNHPDSKLARIVKPFDFGSKITTKDLFTKQDIDKPAKPFLVENSVRRFEQYQIEVSKYDTQLEAELRGYIIDHVTSTGIPVYIQGNEKVGDHNLDALNIALIAFTLEMSPFGKVNYDNTIAFAGQLGEKLPNNPIERMAATNEKQKHKPISRTDLIENKAGLLKQDNRQPSAHTNQTTGRRLWSWPGFESDKPRPQAGRSSPLSNRYHAPPKRKNI